MQCDQHSVKEFLRASRKASDEKVASALSERNCAEQMAQIMAEWSKRAQVLEMCAKIATNPRSDESARIAALWEHSRDDIRFRATQIDPKIDAYGARDEQQTASGEINAWVRRELGTEEVYRDTTNGFFRQRCGFTLNEHSRASRA